MTSDFASLIKKVRTLSVLLSLSCLLNVFLLSLSLFWVLRETPPTPYCELKPVVQNYDELLSLDTKGCKERLKEMSHLSFLELVSLLSSKKKVGSGLRERDLSLACLSAFHHFDISRSWTVLGEPSEKRFFLLKDTQSNVAVSLPLYFDVTDAHFDALIEFASREEYPFTAEGLFSLLKEEKGKAHSKLSEAFLLTPEFWTVDLLFSRSKEPPSKQELVSMLMQGDWAQLDAFVKEQKRLQDASDTRRVKFLMDYAKNGSSQAALFLLRNENEFWKNHLLDDEVVALLKHIPVDSIEGEKLAKEMLLSPRSKKVWQQAALFLYAKTGEAPPLNLSLSSVLTRFMPQYTSPIIKKSVPLLPPGIETKDIAQQKMIAMENFGAKPSVKVSEKPTTISKKTNEISIQKSYTVQEGDTLWKIAKKFGIKVEDIKKCNHLDSDKLKPGLILKIPSEAKEKKS